jgi:hypothetical protein
MTTTTLSLTPLADMPRRWDVIADKPLAFVDAAAEVMSRHKADGTRFDRRNVNLAGATIEVGDDGRTPYLVPPSADTGFALRSHSFKQLTALVNAGKARSYLEELPAPIALDALNWSLRHNGSDGTTLRCAGDSVRAVVSDRFAALDDRPAMGAVYRYLRDAGTLDDFEVVAIASGITTNLRVVLKDTVEGPDGKGLRIGFDLRNSEVGTASLVVRSVVYRMICSNGQIWSSPKSEQRWRHLGDPARMHEDLADVMPSILDEAHGQVDRYQAAHDVTIHIGEARSRLGRLSLTGAQRREALREAAVEAEIIGVADATDAAMLALPEDTKVTLWHLVNGVTAMARETSNTDTRLLLEREAGTLLARMAA